MGSPHNYTSSTLIMVDPGVWEGGWKVIYTKCLIAVNMWGGCTPSVWRKWPPSVRKKCPPPVCGVEGTYKVCPVYRGCGCGLLPVQCGGVAGGCGLLPVWCGGVAGGCVTPPSCPLPQSFTQSPTSTVPSTIWCSTRHTEYEVCSFQCSQWATHSQQCVLSCQ